MADSDGLAARALALEVLAAVEAGGRSDRVLDRALSRGDLGERDRRLATEIVYGTLRRQRSLDRTLRRYSRRPWRRLDGDVRAALRMAAYQCAFTRSVPAHAAVDRTVEAVKRRGGGAAGFANAVLRSWLRNGGELDPGDGGRADRLELPDWLAARWERRADPAAEAWLQRTLEPAPLALRLHPRVAGVEDTIRSLERDGVEAAPSRWVEDAVVVRSGNPLRTAAFRSGAVSPRSEAAQLVTGLLPDTGDPVLDACAGRGGKSVQLGEAVAGRTVVAADVEVGRLLEARRAAAAARVPRLLPAVADLAAGSPFRRRFPAILVDVPCTGLGTIRRHPEIKWRIDEADPAERAALQRRILDTTLELLAPGGRLLYVSCSTEPEENEAVVDAALEADPELLPEAVSAAPGREELVGEDGRVRTWLADPDLDGFFAAMVRRRETGA